MKKIPVIACFLLIPIGVALAIPQITVSSVEFYQNKEELQARVETVSGVRFDGNVEFYLDHRRLFIGDGLAQTTVERERPDAQVAVVNWFVDPRTPFRLLTVVGVAGETAQLLIRYSPVENERSLAVIEDLVRGVSADYRWDRAVEDYFSRVAGAGMSYDSGRTWSKNGSTWFASAADLDQTRVLWGLMLLAERVGEREAAAVYRERLLSWTVPTHVTLDTLTDTRVPALDVRIRRATDSRWRNVSLNRLARAQAAPGEELRPVRGHVRDADRFVRFTREIERFADHDQRTTILMNAAQALERSGYPDEALGFLRELRSLDAGRYRRYQRDQLLWFASRVTFPSYSRSVSAALESEVRACASIMQ